MDDFLDPEDMDEDSAHNVMADELADAYYCGSTLSWQHKTLCSYDGILLPSKQTHDCPVQKVGASEYKIEPIPLLLPCTPPPCTERGGH